MNKDNVLKVADAIENHSIPDLGFNMGGYILPADAETPDLSGHNCGTIGCIAGWAASVAKGSIIDDDASGDKAGKFLGLSGFQRMELFVPSGWLDNNVTSSKAVAVLRHLAETGEVDWSVAASLSEAGGTE